MRPQIAARGGFIFRFGRPPSSVAALTTRGERVALDTVERMATTEEPARKVLPGAMAHADARASRAATCLQTTGAVALMVVAAMAVMWVAPSLPWR